MASDAEEIHVDDVDTRFELEVYENAIVLDISSATVKKIYFEKPGGTVVSQTAGFLTDGKDGVITYVTVPDDLDEVGRWRMQAELELGSEGPWRTDIIEFRVHENL